MRGTVAVGPICVILVLEMNDPKGLLETLSPKLLGYLLGLLPRSDRIVDGLPGGLLTPAFVERLRAEAFSGYVLVQLDQPAYMLFYRGRLLEAWCISQNQHLLGSDAYHAIRRDLLQGEVSLYRLSVETVPAILALTQGSLRIVRVAATGVMVADLREALEQEKFTGSLVLENGSVGRAWYFLKGQLLFVDPSILETGEVPQGGIPRSFREGWVHLVQSPMKPPLDLLEVVREEKFQERQNLLETTWSAAQEVLREYMGRGASPALERLRKIHTTQDPAQLEQTLRQWMEQSLEPSAASLFDRWLRPTQSR
jgi:hypothetical protein